MLPFFDRQTVLKEVGVLGQQKIHKAKIAIVGMGGLGCPAAQYLAAAGVGNLTLIDGDRVEAHNLPRQILYGVMDLGKNKANTSAKKLSEQYPHINIIGIESNLTEKNAKDLLSGCQIVLDGTDTITSKRMLDKLCYEMKKTMIFAGVTGFEGQVSVFNFQSQSNIINSRFSDFFGQPNINETQIQNCHENGVLGPVAGIIATVQALQAIHCILQNEDVLNNKLWVFNAKKLSNRIIRVNPKISPKINNSKPQSMISTINWQQYQELKTKKPDTVLVDVRNADEHLKNNLGGTNVPLKKIDMISDLFEPENPIVLYCSHGRRSARAMHQIKTKYGFEKVYTLTKWPSDQENNSNEK